MPSEPTMDGGDLRDAAGVDERIDAAVRAVQPRIRRLRHAVKAAEEEVREELNKRVGAERFRDEKALVELGPFALGRVAPERFARLVGVAEPGLAPEAVDVIDRADAVLAAFLDSPWSHVVRVPRGGDLRDVVKESLESFGRVFGAARAVELARSGSFDPNAHGSLLGALPFRLWNRAERELGPPLVVDVSGDDCQPSGLGEFLDGRLALVLVATGSTTPAPLARLITPGTLVMQTADPADLARLEATEHPTIALLFDEDRPSQAHFVHDPDAGDTPLERLAVTRMPSEAHIGRGRRAPVWLEDLAQLRTLSAWPAGASATQGGGGGTGASMTEGGGDGASASVADGAGGRSSRAEGRAKSGPSATEEDEGRADETSADRLAAWLIARAGLEDASWHR